jgi:hypothetical protein
VSQLVSIDRDDLAAIYSYARQFDVDDDPVMLRVKALLAAPKQPAADPETTGGVAQKTPGESP